MDNVMKVICLWQIAYCRRCDQLHGRDGHENLQFVGAFEKRRWYAAEEGVTEVYAFELVEKGIMNWGLLHRNMTSKYSFEFSDGGEGGKGRR
ncbi:hypothetical protein Bca52824_010247 [Brassica carinata]|uniref:Uncharacterized protein n=1 Tax=Brassica carinata TaxID=52824 RepID=A0A8X8B7I7_BRACI|nr:hypothetical protein Bca52824_010247 [Brassica carinata]